MRWDVLTRHTSLLIIFLSISLAYPLFGDDFAQAPFEVAAASPILVIANPNAINFDLSGAIFGTESTALDSSPVNDRVIVAGGAQQQNLPQKKKDHNPPPSWIRKVPGKGAPKPSNPNIPEGAWGRYPGYPNENTNLDDMYELDPNTRERLRFKRQPRWHCDEGLALFCCRPLLILCHTCESVPVSSLSSVHATSSGDGIRTLELGSQSQELTWFAPASFSQWKMARMHPKSAKVLWNYRRCKRIFHCSIPQPTHDLSQYLPSCELQKESKQKPLLKVLPTG